jgi:RNA polymerase sigma-70 factor (ECF subfamily)
VVFSGEVGATVERAMSELSDVERSAFVLRHFEGLSIEEIGQALGLRASATKNSIFRAVQKLRRALEPMVSTTQ